MHLLPPQGQVQTLAPHALTHLVSLRLTTLRHRQLTMTQARIWIRKLQQVIACLVAFCTCGIALPRGSSDAGLAGLALACSKSWIVDSAAPVLAIVSFWVCFAFGKPSLCAHR